MLEYFLYQDYEKSFRKNVSHATQIAQVAEDPLFQVYELKALGLEAPHTSGRDPGWESETSRSEQRSDPSSKVRVYLSDRY